MSRSPSLHFPAPSRQRPEVPFSETEFHHRAPELNFCVGAGAWSPASQALRQSAIACAGAADRPFYEPAGPRSPCKDFYATAVMVGPRSSVSRNPATWRVCAPHGNRFILNHPRVWGDCRHRPRQASAKPDFQTNASPSTRPRHSRTGFLRRRAGQ